MTDAARLASRRLPAVGLFTTLLVSGCAGGAGTASTEGPVSGGLASWQSLATPRPLALPGAPRVSVGPVQILARGAPDVYPVPTELAVQELTSLGLLRRRDVEFVERRRFAAAAERERRGESRPTGAPPVGVSEGAEFVATATWASVGLDSSYVDVRIADATTGQIVSTWRGAADRDADLVAIGRRIVRGILDALDGLEPLPRWTDPELAAYERSGVSEASLDAFLAGLAAEERWAWDGARVGYLAAIDTGTFLEAEAAMARAARLRTGGTLAES